MFLKNKFLIDHSVLLYVYNQYVKFKEYGIKFAIKINTDI